MSNPTPDKPAATTKADETNHRAPCHRDIYVLLVGVLVGVLLGPGVLGQVWPWAYDQLFIGSGPARSELAAYEKTNQDVLTRLEQSGATAEAVTEKRLLMESQRLPMEAQMLVSQKQHRDWLRGRSAALVAAVLVLMVIEAMLGSMQGPTWQRLRHRLTTARYAIMAVWVAVLLAEPSGLGDASLVTFIALLVLVSLVFAYLPMGWLRYGRRTVS